MNAAVVYQVAKALPEEERIKLYDLLKNDIQAKYNTDKEKQPLLTQEEALAYLINKIFTKKPNS